MQAENDNCPRAFAKSFCQKMLWAVPRTKDYACEFDSGSLNNISVNFSIECIFVMLNLVIVNFLYSSTRFLIVNFKKTGKRSSNFRLIF